MRAGHERTGHAGTALEEASGFAAEGASSGREGKGFDVDRGSFCVQGGEELSLKQFRIGVQCLGALLQKMSWEGMDREGYHSNLLDLY